MVSEVEMKRRASAAGYELLRDYADDYDVKQCSVCRRYGRYGDEVIELKDGSCYCPQHRPVKEES
jgi:hypothetical protein